MPEETIMKDVEIKSGRTPIANNGIAKVKGKDISIHSLTMARGQDLAAGTTYNIKGDDGKGDLHMDGEYQGERSRKHMFKMK